MTEVILEAPGQEPVIQLHPLHPLREICVIRGRLEEILEANKDSICEDYVSIVLTDEEELYQPKEQLERIFTHILEVRTERNRKLVQEWEDGQAEDTQTDPKLVFEQFFSQIQGRKLQEEEAAVLEEVFAKIRRKKDETDDTDDVRIWFLCGLRDNRFRAGAAGCVSDHGRYRGR